MVHPTTRSRLALIAGLTLRACAASVILVGLVPSPLSAGQPDPRYGYVEDFQWNDLKAKYAQDHGAVIAEWTKDVKLKGDDLEITERLVYAVFDVDRATEVLNQHHILLPGMKFKELHAWSHELGSPEAATWLDKKDIHRERIIGGFQDVRFAFPGIRKSGVVGFVMKTKSPPEYFDMDFMRDTPVVEGTFRLVFPGKEGRFVAYFLRARFKRVLAGNVTESVPGATKQGYVMEWIATDVPPLRYIPLLAAEDADRAYVGFVGKWSWKAISDGYATMYGEYSISEHHLNAARDTLVDAGTAEITDAIARHLDDPERFELIADDRPRRVRLGQEHEGLVEAEEEVGAIDLALLAHLYLRGLGVESHMVLAASRFLTDLDWEITSAAQFDAALVWVPEMGSTWIWDVADRTVPRGLAGADLNREMLVIEEDPGDPVQEFEVWAAPRRERCVTSWQFAGDEVVRGSMELCIEDEPFDALEPWNEERDLMEDLVWRFPETINVVAADWVSYDPDRRFSAQRAAVLRCGLETEAAPVGESGWEVRAPSRRLPQEILDGASTSRTKPVTFARGIAYVDTVWVDLGTAEAQTPSFMEVKNASGRVRVFWKRHDDGRLCGVRRIEIPRRRIEDLAELQELVAAWTAVQEQPILVE